MTGNRKKKQAGFSLIEVLVSTVLFIMILLSASGIFRIVIESQRRAISSQNVQENLKYFLEVVSKEIRMAKKDAENTCPNVPSDIAFAVSANSYGDVLYLKNYHDECVAYYLVQDASGAKRFAINRAGTADYISPGKIDVSALKFLVTQGSLGQPIVTVSLRAKAIGAEQYSEEMVIQTSLTSRYYK